MSQRRFRLFPVPNCTAFFNKGPHQPAAAAAVVVSSGSDEDTASTKKAKKEKGRRKEAHKSFQVIEFEKY